MVEVETQGISIPGEPPAADEGVQSAVASGPEAAAPEAKPVPVADARTEVANVDTRGADAAGSGNVKGVGKPAASQTKSPRKPAVTSSTRSKKSPAAAPAKPPTPERPKRQKATEFEIRCGKEERQSLRRMRRNARKAGARTDKAVLLRAGMLLLGEKSPEEIAALVARLPKLRKGRAEKR